MESTIRSTNLYVHMEDFMSRKSGKFEGGIVVGQTKTGQEDVKSTSTTGAEKAKKYSTAKKSAKSSSY